MKKFLTYVIILITSLITLSSCSQQMYTVSFDTLMIDKVESVSVRNFNKIDEPPHPVREGHTFMGWSYNGEKWDFKTDRVKGDMTLKAIWSKNIYTISFDITGTEPYAPIKEEYGTRVVLPRPTRKEAIFGGWEYNGDIVNVIDVPSENITLKAIWDVDQKYWPIISNKLTKYRGEEEIVYVPGYWLLDRKITYLDIGFGCFQDNKVIKEAIIQDGIKVIEDSAFIWCSNLTKVTIPNTVTKIGMYTFAYTNLKEIVIPESVEVIKSFAFYDIPEDAIIYASVEEQPETWYAYWAPENVKVYWKNEWTYDSNGNPIVK